MSVARIEEMRQERASAYERMKEISDAAVDGKRDLTAEETGEFSKIEARFDELTASVERAERLEGLGPKVTRSIVTPSGEVVEETPAEERKVPKSLAEFKEQRQGVKPQDAPEYREAFYSWLMTPDERSMPAEELRVLSKGSAGAGLNLVPTQFQNTLIEQLRQFGVMRDISTVITTAAGEALQIPTVSAYGTGAWTAENASYTASDDTFGQATLNAYKYTDLMIVSEELLTDAAFDLEAYIARQFGARIGVGENTAYVNGSGSGQPTGVTTQATAGQTTAGATAITGDDVIGLFHSLAPQYRRNASWVLNDTAVRALRTVKETTGNYIWQPGLQAGDPDLLLGKPVHVDPDLNGAITTGLITGLFGDFSYYWIRDVDGIQFQRLNELYSANGQIGFRAFHRTDGKLLNTQAIKKLTQA